MTYRIVPVLFFLIFFGEKATSQTPNTPCDSILKIAFPLYQKQNYKAAIPPFEIALRYAVRIQA